MTDYVIWNRTAKIPAFNAIRFCQIIHQDKWLDNMSADDFIKFDTYTDEELRSTAKMMTGCFMWGREAAQMLGLDRD